MPASMPPGTIAVAGNRQTRAASRRRRRHRDPRARRPACPGRPGPDRAVRARARAAERALTSDYLTLLAQRARLLAERTGQRDFAPPPEFASLSPEDREIAAQVMQLQRSEMHARSGSVSAQQSVLGQRAQQLVQQQGGYVKQREALIEQQRLIGEELDGPEEHRRKGLRVDEPGARARARRRPTSRARRPAWRPNMPAPAKASAKRRCNR